MTLKDRGKELRQWRMVTFVLKVYKCLYYSFFVVVNNDNKKGRSL